VILNFPLKFKLQIFNIFVIMEMSVYIFESSALLHVSKYVRKNPENYGKCRIAYISLVDRCLM